jgi:dUTP pyrophosphatase
MQTLQIKQLSPNATLPTRTHTTDSGLDIYAAEDTIVTHTHAVIIPTGIAINIPEGYEGTIRPRSGKSVKTNLRVVLGTIDAGFNGEIGVIADALDRSNYLVQRGEKIAQLVIQKVELPQLEIVDQFDTVSERGEKGFGSSDEVHP